MATKRIDSWEVSGEIWKIVELLIPKRLREKGRIYKRKPGGGRKPLEPRRVFEGLVYTEDLHSVESVAKKQFGSSSPVREYFNAREREGFFY